ncbi:aerotolerance regulator BatA [Photobacterium sanctipauli]|uniref:Aerotolerance regulator BatA n=1 Tax=Photobacterium sanctipauli TaxID=1342794 RepID=A0A2T3N9B0_9GAMM|nr:VWA domain-containing protein [Photobacterium sanctipauli]PSW09998.1 aerotolerance regulator BatA [Photobacterium sanctipauli]
MEISVINISGLALEFAHPLALLLLPLPVAVYWLIPAYRTKKVAIKVPFFNTILDVLGETPSEGASQLSPRWWQRIILVLSWALLVIALAKPLVLGDPQVREQMGRDVMVVLDLSGSMAETDFVLTNDDGKKQRVSRLDAAQQVLSNFAETRKGDRLGLILFGDAAFIQTPFTADLQVWLGLLEQTDVAMAGQSTHLGDAIGLAVKVFDAKPFEQGHKQGSGPIDHPREKVAIVLTDGNDTGSFVEPIDAAKVANAKGVRIHMIAMGDPTTVGEQALDMKTIERVATITGGESFQALNQTELELAYDNIGQLEPQLYESTTYRPKQTIHHYLVAIVVALYLLAFTVVSVQKLIASRLAAKASSVNGSTVSQGEQHV